MRLSQKNRVAKKVMKTVLFKTKVNTFVGLIIKYLKLMKQHYLFTCVASLFCALAANAQEAVIDSLVEYNGNDERTSLTIYRYNDQQLVEEQNIYSWDATAGRWGTEPTGHRTYAYDEQGRTIRTEYQSDTYQETYVYTYEGQSRTFDCQYSTVLENGDVYSDQQYGEQELDENGNVIKQKLYYNPHTDDQYLASEMETTYDDQSRVLSSQSTNYDLLGNELSTNTSENAWSDDGSYYIYTSTFTDVVAGTTSSYQFKYVIGEGNPRIDEQYTMNEGEWVKTWSGYYYYAGGSGTTANEAIQAEPNMRLYTADGTIHLQLAEPQWVEVYTICGQCRYRKVVSGSTSIPVTKGIYIIRAGKETVKVQVR